MKCYPYGGLVRMHIIIEFFMALHSLVGQSLLIIEASRSHPETPHAVGLLWTSDQPGAQTST
jgi:hypothetical protein